MFRFPLTEIEQHFAANRHGPGLGHERIVVYSQPRQRDWCLQTNSAPQIS